MAAEAYQRLEEMDKEASLAKVIAYIRERAIEFHLTASDPRGKLSVKARDVAAIRANVEWYFDDIDSHTSQETLAYDSSHEEADTTADSNQVCRAITPQPAQSGVETFWVLVKDLVEVKSQHSSVAGPDCPHQAADHGLNDSHSLTAQQRFENFLKQHPPLLLQLSQSIDKHQKNVTTQSQRQAALKALLAMQRQSRSQTHSKKRSCETTSAQCEESRPTKRSKASRKGGSSLKRTQTCYTTANLSDSLGLRTTHDRAHSSDELDDDHKDISRVHQASP